MSLIYLWRIYVSRFFKIYVCYLGVGRWGSEFGFIEGVDQVRFFKEIKIGVGK